MITPVKTVFEVLANCRMTRTWTVGMCGQFCARMYGFSASGYRDAVAQWQATPMSLRHDGATDAPAGALLYWGGGSAGHGHVAVSDGTGGIWSIDISGPGTVSQVPAGTINTRWGLPYLGWAAPYFQGQEWSPAMIYGVDVSAYQSAQFPLTTPGDHKPVDYAFMKVTQGLGYINPLWVAQRQWARDNGLAVGFYHYPDMNNSPVTEADHFLAQVAWQPGDIIALDWEGYDQANRNVPKTRQLSYRDGWLAYVKGKMNPHRVGMYCNTDYWRNVDTNSNCGDFLWIATADLPPGQPGITFPWTFHQYSTSGNLDHDVAQFASRQELIDWAGGDMALSADDKKWISSEIKNQVQALMMATSLVDSKAHGFGYFLAHLEKTATDLTAQAKANGASLTELKTVLSAVDLSQLPAEVAAKVEALKLVVTVTEGP